MVQIKNPLTVIKSGGGTITRPTTWAEFKALSQAQAQLMYPVGSTVDLDCKIRIGTGSSSTLYNLKWEVADYGTTNLENDNTDYPCVTLWCKTNCATSYYDFDALEREAASEATALDGVYYFGSNDNSTYTPLNLSTGQPVPYGSYTYVYHTSVTNDATYFKNLTWYGYNNYYYSNIRQWLNATGAAGSWYTPSHVGDSCSISGNMGFLRCFTYDSSASDFAAILSATKVVTYGNTLTDGGNAYTSYDKFFLPSYVEVGMASSPVEGSLFGCVKTNADRSRAAINVTLPTANATQKVRLRSCSATNNMNNTGIIKVDQSKGADYPYATGNANAPCCRIIFTGN